MSKRLLDSRGSVISEGVVDPMTGVLTVRRRQDVEPIIEANKRHQTDGTDGYWKSRDGKHVASVPHVVYETWQKEFCKREGIRFFWQRDRVRWKKFLRTKLNDSDNRAWRTAPGRL